LMRGFWSTKLIDQRSTLLSENMLALIQNALFIS
jgi:hypothetical protein